MPRKSILQNKEAVVSAVAQSSSMREALETLGLRAAGGNYKQLHKYCNLYEIEVPVATGYQHTEAARKKNRLDDSLVLCENCTALRNSVKLRIKDIIEYKCGLCGITDAWNNLPIKLQLDHINGIHNDNRIENLRWLCPNCHSQTDTFCSKNRVRSDTNGK